MGAAVVFQTVASVEVCVVKLKVVDVPRARSLGQSVLFKGLHDVQVCAAAGERSESMPTTASVEVENMMAKTERLDNTASEGETFLKSDSTNIW